jgi:formiminotetrahydrofolate cyclodeaminase
MDYDSSVSIAEFLTAAASKCPAPGGGSVTALAGALAASMGGMVVNYSIGKKDLAASQELFRVALAEFSRARSVLLRLMIEDQAAFESLSAARKAAKGAGEQDPAFAAALLACIRIPQAVGATAMAILELSEQLAQSANRHLLSDLAVCSELAMATLRCAACNVQANLPDVSDAAERARFEQASTQLIARATGSIQRIMPIIRRRTAST